MDRLIYVAMSGAKQTMLQQATVANNLANVTTTGFRAQQVALRAAPVIGEGLPTRAFVVDSTPGADFRQGAIQHTGRDLDVAIEGRGWIAVQAADGTEAYTRAGSLEISGNGVLQTRGGLSVMGDGGPISVPPDTRVTVGRDGTVSTVPEGNRPNQVAALGRIKLVNPEESQLIRGSDGLFRMREGGAAAADPQVRMVGAALEGSNVNAVDAMVTMIALARQFDMQIKMMQNAEGNDRQASQILASR
ncbi:MAG: flagellar basal-body rod protein FlgF [Burkholderiales bacterium]|nr:flagellar basal-body rod protein FlgF [Burkholderiales bacterium]